MEGKNVDEMKGVEDICQFLSIFHKIDPNLYKGGSSPSSHDPRDHHISNLNIILQVLTKKGDFLKVFDYFTKILPISDVYNEVLANPGFETYLFIMAKENPVFLVEMINEMVNYYDPKPHVRFLRQSLFFFCIENKDDENALKIIKSLRPVIIDTDYSDFCSFISSIVTVVSYDPFKSRSVFEYIMGVSTMFTGWKRDSLISFALSLAPLLKTKSLHQSFFDYVLWASEQAGNFRKYDLPKSLLNDQLPLNSAPGLIRPFYLDSLFNVNIRKLSSFKNPVEAYNSLIEITQSDPNQAIKVLSQFSNEVSLPFYYSMKDSHPDMLQIELCKSFESTDQTKALLIVEKAMKANLSFVKPYYHYISEIGFIKASQIVIQMIRNDIIDFQKLWPFLNQCDFDSIKFLLREGIVQFQKRPKSIENTRFILNVLRHYFPDLKNWINWFSVAESFHNDVNMSSTILMNYESDNDQDSGMKYLLSWRHSFLMRIKNSPSNYQRSMALPFLLLLSGEDDISKNSIKWVSRFFPLNLSDSETIIEACAITEICRTFILKKNTQSKEWFKDVFDFNESKITSYFSVYVHLAYVLENRIFASIPIIFSGLKQNVSIQKAAKVSLNIIFYNNISEVIPYIEHIRMPIVSKIMSMIYSNIVSSESPYLSPRDMIVEKILSNTHNTLSSQFIDIINKTEFSSSEMLYQHFLFLSLSCYLLIPSHKVPVSSIERISQLMRNPSSRFKQYSFCILALSQIQTSFEYDFIRLIKGNPSLCQPVISFATKRNDQDLIYKAIEYSSSILDILPLKPLIPYLEKDYLKKYINRVGPNSSIFDLALVSDIFNISELLFVLIDHIRKKDIISLYQSSSLSILISSMRRIPSEEIDTKFYATYDDFAFLVSLETGVSISNICWNLLNGDVTVRAAFMFTSKSQQVAQSFITSMIAIMQTLSESKIIKTLRLLSPFLLSRSKSAPFSSIRSFYSANPSEYSDEISESLLPSLLISANYLNLEQLTALSEVFCQLKNVELYQTLKQKLKI